MNEVVVELAHGCPGGYRPGTVIKYTNIPRHWQPPDWHASAGARPFVGALPPDAKTVDVEAEQLADHASWMFYEPAKPALRKDAVKKRLGLTHDAQLTEAIDHVGCPKGVIRTTTERAWTGGEELARYQEWTDKEISDYEEVLRRVFPGALPKR